METMMLMWQSHELGWRLQGMGAHPLTDILELQSKAYGLKKALILAGVTWDVMSHLQRVVEAFAALVAVGLQQESDLAAYIAAHKEG